MFEFLVNDSSGETQLSCRFEIINWWTLWPRYKRCVISDAILSNRSDNIKFVGAISELNETTSVYFEDSGLVEFIPLIFQQFPNLNGLEITDSKIPILINDLFSYPNFQKIQYLQLCCNQIVQIEENAFGRMRNLKWINLYYNKLTSLDSKIFKNNLQLQFINFEQNKINLFHPSLFWNLNNLKILRFSGGNICYNSEIGCSTCSIATEEINQKFQICYENYRTSTKYLQEKETKKKDEEIGNEN